MVSERRPAVRCGELDDLVPPLVEVVAEQRPPGPGGRAVHGDGGVLQGDAHVQAADQAYAGVGRTDGHGEPAGAAAAERAAVVADDVPDVDDVAGQPLGHAAPQRRGQHETDAHGHRDRPCQHDGSAPAATCGPRATDGPATPAILRWRAVGGPALVLGGRAGGGVGRTVLPEGHPGEAYPFPGPFPRRDLRLGHPAGPQERHHQRLLGETPPGQHVRAGRPWQPDAARPVRPRLQLPQGHIGSGELLGQCLDQVLVAAHPFQAGPGGRLLVRPRILTAFRSLTHHFPDLALS